jgi:hypothetical protein
VQRLRRTWTRRGRGGGRRGWEGSGRAGATPEAGQRCLMGEEDGEGAQGHGVDPDFDCLEIFNEQPQPILRT